jgi:hypothetical protein
MIAGVHVFRPEFQESGSWCFVHGNASAHASRLASQFLAKRGIPVLCHPCYSLDLETADFLFPNVKIPIKCARREAVS